jgi:hypothetical protein
MTNSRTVARLKSDMIGSTPHEQYTDHPPFDACFPDLNEFILELVQDYEAGNIQSWDDLDRKVKLYFSPRRMTQMETLVPGWQKMASFSEGITLVHVLCVFLGMFMLPEFQLLTPAQKQMAKWIVLFHDIDKVHLPGKKDPMHAFRSGVQAANLLPRFGFPTRQKFSERIGQWSRYAVEAFVLERSDGTAKPDNQKLPAILIGIDNLFGKNTPAALITKTALLHISLAIDPLYHTPAPLTDKEIQRYIDPELFPLLRVMMFADNEGWALFEAETRAQRRTDAEQAFQKIETLTYS